MVVIDKTAPQIDRFRIHSLLEEDAFRAIYAGEDLETEQPVQVAVLRAEVAADTGFRAAYRRRSATLAQVRHPNITAVLASGLTTSDLPYLASAAVEGYPLSERLERLRQQRTTAHVTYALTLVRQVAAGMALAEKLDLAHYCLTPDHVLLKNITLKTEDSVLVTDLDIPATAAPDESDSPYLAPEQRAGNAPDSASHVYALGAILFELLGGELPPRGVPLRHRIAGWFGGPSALARLRPDLTVETYALVERALQKNPRRRYGSVSAFLEALDGALEAEELRIHAGTYTEPRPGRPYFLFPLLLLLLCIGAALATQSLLPAFTLADATETPLARAAAAVDSPTATAAPPTTTPLPPTPLPVVAATNTAVPSRTSTPTRRPAATATASPAPPTSTPAAPSATPPPTFRVDVSSANLRLGPGTNYEVSGYVLRGEEVIVLARNDGDFVWYNVLTRDGRNGWLAADIGAPTGPDGLAGVEIAATIPVPPTPTPTPTPTNTPTSTPTPTAAPAAGGGGGGGTSSGGSGQPPPATPTPPF